MKPTVLENDFVFDKEYSKQIKNASEEQIGLKDTIIVKIFAKDEIYSQKYYYDGN